MLCPPISQVKLKLDYLNYFLDNLPELPDGNKTLSVVCTTLLGGIQEIPIAGCEEKHPGEPETGEQRDHQEGQPPAHQPPTHHEQDSGGVHTCLNKRFIVNKLIYFKII